MDIQVTQTGGVTLVLPHGDLDMGTADHVKRMLTELIAKGQSKLVMDLTAVSDVDSSRLGALVAALKHAAPSRPPQPASLVGRPLVVRRGECLTAPDAAHGPVDNVTLQARQGEFFTIVGPQRSGKSMLLRLVAGFAEPRGGRVLFEGGNITHTPPGRRGIGFVFQDGALWPHLNVFEHVAFGLRAGRAPAEEVERRVPRVLSRL